MADKKELVSLPRRIAEILEGGDLGAASTKLLNELGFDTPKQKLEKQKLEKKKRDKPMNVETINVKKGGLIKKYGVQKKGTSPLLKKRK
jgi:hypothetical protein